MDEFLHTSLCLLSSDIFIPRISLEIKKVLYLTEQGKVGDWYLYNNYIDIRIYGFEIPLYILPNFVPVRIFSLKYIRQMLNMDDLHFVSNKKKAQFKLKAYVGPHIVNTKEKNKEVDELLKQIKFKLSSTWSYDPLAIISKLRVEQKYAP